MSQFTHAICPSCWQERYTFAPYRVSEKVRHVERCCFCSVSTTDGIFVREDPEKLPFHVDHSVALYGP